MSLSAHEVLKLDTYSDLDLNLQAPALRSKP